MKRVLDNRIAALLANHPDALQACEELVEFGNRFVFRWPSLLEYLGLGALLRDLPAFEPGSVLFEACVDAISTHKDQETLFYLYDRLFTENLNWVRDLEQIQPLFLFQRIEDREKQIGLEVQQMVKESLEEYKRALKENSRETMHDLVLFLAWERMCDCLSRIFDAQISDPGFLSGLEQLKSCLVESYQHIKGEGRTLPSAYSLFCALFYYYMREEQLQRHNTQEWAILSVGFPLLKGPNELGDFFYIDEALALDPSHPKSEEVYLTAESPDQIKSRLTFAGLINQKLQAEVPDWRYALRTLDVQTVSLIDTL